MQYLLLCAGEVATKAEEMLVVLSTRKPSVCQRLRPVWSAEGSDDDDEADADRPLLRDNDPTLGLMPLRAYLTSAGMLGKREAEGRAQVQQAHRAAGKHGPHRRAGLEV